MSRKPSIAKTKPGPAPESSIQVAGDEAVRLANIEVTKDVILQIARRGKIECEMTLTERHALIACFAAEMLTERPEVKLTPEQKALGIREATLHRRTG